MTGGGCAIHLNIYFEFIWKFEILQLGLQRYQVFYILKIQTLQREADVLPGELLLRCQQVLSSWLYRYV
jgi:hypothetical protein